VETSGNNSNVIKGSGNLCGADASTTPQQQQQQQQIEFEFMERVGRVGMAEEVEEAIKETIEQKLRAAEEVEKLKQLETETIKRVALDDDTLDDELTIRVPVGYAKELLTELQETQTRLIGLIEMMKKLSGLIGK